MKCWIRTDEDDSKGNPFEADIDYVNGVVFSDYQVLVFLPDKEGEYQVVYRYNGERVHGAWRDLVWRANDDDSPILILNHRVW